MPPAKNKNSDLVVKYSESEIKSNFVPVDEKDVARAVDVPVNEKSSDEIETVEYIGGKKPEIKNQTQKTKTKSKIKKTKYWTEEFKIPGVKKLKPNGPILIITEKPQAAQKIAVALAEKSLSKKLLGGVSYYEFIRDNKEIQVACAVGHLFTVAQLNPRNKWPTFEIGWAPNFLVRKNDFTKKYYNVIATLCKKSSEIIIGTDYDIEGEVIGMNIVKYICNQSDAGRMKFSTLTSDEISQAYDARLKTLDWKQAIAGETRHYLDWMYGINLSRALMDAIKKVGAFRLMSIGRVQGPSLNIIVKREHEIQNFKPEKYWDVALDVTDGKNTIEVKYPKDISKEKELDKFKDLKGKKGEAKTEKSQRKLSPMHPLDLTTLQTEAYRLYKLNPSKTLQIAQRLYLAGVISYPRTSSQKIPKEIGYDKIIKKLSNIFDFIKLAKRKTPIEGKKSDPAHPSIFPTGEFQELESDDKKIYELIVRRFVSCFCDDAIIDIKKININVEGINFVARGISIETKGWMNVYPYQMNEKELKDIGSPVTVLKVKIEEKFTQPPHRYTPASIISELEKKNLGTKATRASIIETLFDRGYINGTSLQATSLGISLIDTLEQNCPIIIDEQLTRNIEKSLEDLRNSKDYYKKENSILEDSKKIINKAGEQFEKNKEKIGNDLVNATAKLWEQQKKDNEISDCSVCKKGMLAIKYNKMHRRYFVACNNYPECKTTFTLPPNSLIKKTDKKCEQCGFPMLISLRKGKKPWIFCFNPICPTRKSRGDNKENKQDNKESNEEKEISEEESNKEE